uniref:Uncharacterized protein n=1 Tax=Mycetohabitans sp. TaxID=2571162 RepID=A0A6B9HDL4_9BURK|nr:hypothetical protein [Mycetohabitans sp.]
MIAVRRLVLSNAVLVNNTVSSAVGKLYLSVGEWTAIK